MRDRFKRSATTRFSIYAPKGGTKPAATLRAELSKCVQPMVDYLASELVAVALNRLDADIERMGEAFEVAVSAFASEVENGNTDRRADDSLPEVQRSAGRRLHDDGERELAAVGDRPVQVAAQAPNPGRSEGERPARLVEPAPDLIAQHLGPDIAAMLTPPRHRDLKPANVPQRPASGARKPNTCSNCGFAGGNARGCGRAHTTVTKADQHGEAPTHVAVSPDHGDVDAPAVHVRREPARRPQEAASPNAARDRIASIAARAKAHQPAGIVAAEPEERWSPERIAEERELAENSKHDGSLPRARRTFGVARARGGDLGEVEELDFGSEG